MEGQGNIFKTYSLEITILVAALLISSTMMVSVGNLTKSGGVAIATTGGSLGAGQAGTGGVSGAQAATGGTGAAGQAPAASGDWSFASSMPFIGPADAKVTVVEFADFQCPFCGISFGRDIGGARYAPIRGTATNITSDYAKTNRIKFIYIPEGFLGQESVDAANAALCAREVGGDTGFFQMHDKLFTEQGEENGGTFSKVNLKKFGADIGFNTSAFTTCIDGDKYASVVQQAGTFASSVGVGGTPTFALNNRILPNGSVYASLKAAVDAALAAS